MMDKDTPEQGTVPGDPSEAPDTTSGGSPDEPDSSDPQSDSDPQSSTGT